MKKNRFDSEILILNDKYVLLEDVLNIPDGQTVELDLGCGTGDLAVGLAEKYPDRCILAADVMLGRLRKVAGKAHQKGISESLRYLRVEARHLCGIILPDASVDRLHILCPDPWPKHKHKGRRLTSSDFMVQIHRILKPGGVFHFATDDVAYMESTLKNIRESGLFLETDGSPIRDVSDIKTEFERQWLSEGKSVPHVAFLRR